MDVSLIISHQFYLISVVPVRVRSLGQIITDLFSLVKIKFSSPLQWFYTPPRPSHSGGWRWVWRWQHFHHGLPGSCPHRHPQAWPQWGQLVLTRLLVLETMGKCSSSIFQSLRGKSNFNPVMCLDSGSLLQISTHDDHHQCQSVRPQILKYFHIFEATEREGWLLLGQLELISVVNKDKTAEPRDIISFTNHLVPNNRAARKEAFRETETVGSLEAQSVPWKLWENVGSLNYQIIYLLVSVTMFFLLKMCPWLPTSPPPIPPAT